MLTTGAPTNHPRVLKNNDGSWKKYIIEIYLFDEICQYAYMYRMFTRFVHNKPVLKNGLRHVPYKQHLLSKVVNSRWMVGCIPLQFSITINYTQHMAQIIQRIFIYTKT